MRPVLDYRELNQYVSSHTASIVVCNEKLRAWRKQGSNPSIFDLRCAYFQLHLHLGLSRYLVVQFQKKHFCLIRLELGLIAAPMIMTAAVQKVLTKNRALYGLLYRLNHRERRHREQSRRVPASPILQSRVQTFVSNRRKSSELAFSAYSFLETLLILAEAETIR